MMRSEWAVTAGDLEGNNSREIEVDDLITAPTGVSHLCTPPTTLCTMGWFASLFSSSNSSLQGKRKVLSSTQEAFSLPSPVSAQNGLFTAGSSFGSPDPESTAVTPSFTYPPPSNGTQYNIVSSGCVYSGPFLVLS